MGRKRKYTTAQVKVKKVEAIDYLKTHHGIVSPMLKELDIPTSAYYEWLELDPDFKKQVDDVQEVTLDYVENKLFELINKGDKAAVIFYLKCKGKDRNYIERTQIDQTTQISYTEPIRINVYAPRQIEGGEEQKQIE